MKFFNQNGKVETPCHLAAREIYENKIRLLKLLIKENDLNKVHVNVVENLLQENKGMELCLTFNNKIYGDPLEVSHYVQNILDRLPARIDKWFDKRYDMPRVSEHLKDIILVSEWSDAGRFHYHGKIHMTHKMLPDYLRRYFSKVFGRIRMRCIKYPDSYVNYVLKTFKKPDDLIIEISNWRFIHFTKGECQNKVLL